MEQLWPSASRAWAQDQALGHHFRLLGQDQTQDINRYLLVLHSPLDLSCCSPLEVLLGGFVILKIGVAPCLTWVGH